MEEQEGGVRVHTYEGKRPEKHITPIRTTTVINYTTNKQLQRQNVTKRDKSNTLPLFHQHWRWLSVSTQ